MKKKNLTRHKLTKDKRAAAISLVAAGENVADIAALYKVSRENVYALCRTAGIKLPKRPSRASRIRMLKEKIDKL